jgi:hypothetical protein
MIKYKARVQNFGHYYLDGQIVEGTKIYKDDAGLWLLYEEIDKESEWLLIEASSLEEIEVKESI